VKYELLPALWMCSTLLLKYEFKFLSSYLHTLTKSLVDCTGALRNFDDIMNSSRCKVVQLFSNLFSLSCHIKFVLVYFIFENNWQSRLRLSVAGELYTGI